MSLEKLKEEVVSQAEKQAKTVMQEAEREQEKILDEAKARAKELIEQKKTLGRMQAKEVSVELRASAMLQAKRIESEAREEVVEKVFQEVKSELEEAAKGGSYEKIFDSLVKQAIKALGEKEFVLKCNARDKKLASKYGQVAAAIDAIGGVAVAKTDGSIQINNTFEALLEENEEKIKQKAFEELFGKESQKTAAERFPKQEAKRAPQAKDKKKKGK